MTLPDALLIDMDGTLVDTEPYWEIAKIQLAAKYDIPFTSADAAELVGKSMMVTVRALQDAGVPLNDEEILLALVDDVERNVANGIPWISGAQDFLARMGEAGIPCALVTQAWEPVARYIVDASNGVLQVLVSGSEVQHAKPHPEPYLLAAERLGVDIHRCVAMEDSPSGVTSAETAGAQVIVMPGMHEVADSPNRHPVKSLEAIDTALLARVLGNAWTTHRST